MTAPAPIEVLAIRRLDGTSTVKAFVDLRLGGVTIKGAKIVQQEGQRAWLAMPSVKTDRAWQNVVELSKKLRSRATGMVLEEWEGGGRVPPPHRGQATQEAVRQRADEVAPKVLGTEERRDPGQHHTGDPARPFDDECPF